VRIPAFILEDATRETLKEYAQKSMGMWNGAHVILKGDIELPRSHLDTVEYSLWYTSIYDFPSQLILDLYEYQHAFKGKVRFIPRIITFEAQIAPQKLKVKDCLSDGKYCFISPKGNIKQEDLFHQRSETPRKILEESLRQKCVYELASDSEMKPRNKNKKYTGDWKKDEHVWFSYMYTFYTTCLNTQ